MAILNLIDQNKKATTINTHIQQLKTQMDARKEVWDKLSPERKKKWILSNKDPIMTLAWQIFKYLRNNFFEEAETNV